MLYHGPQPMQCRSPVPPPNHQSVMVAAASRPHSMPRPGGRERRRARMPGGGPGTTRGESVPGALGVLIELPTKKRRGDRGPAPPFGGCMPKPDWRSDRRGSNRRALRDHVGQWSLEKPHGLAVRSWSLWLLGGGSKKSQTTLLQRSENHNTDAFVCEAHAVDIAKEARQAGRRNRTRLENRVAEPGLGRE